jgi:choice-of-anchor C domain-containing protein
MLIDHRALAVCATMGLAMLPGATRANLLTNGNFASVCGSGSFCAYGAGDSTSIPTWTVGSGGVDLITGYWQSPPGGGNSIDLDELAPGSVQTSFGTNAGTEYMLSFELSGNPDGGNPVKTVEVDVAGVIQTFTFDTSIAGNNESNMKWVLETLTFTATGATTNLKFLSLDDPDSAYGAAIGNVSVVAVPEPGTLALLGVGLLATGGFVRRKSRR